MIRNCATVIKRAAHNLPGTKSHTQEPALGMSTVHLLVGDDAHSTHTYFKHAITSSRTYSVNVWSGDSDVSVLPADDLLFYVDPGPGTFPLPLEKVPCLTIAYLIDVHQELKSRLDIAQFFDVIFVAQPNYLPDFYSRGILQASWMPLACDPQLHRVQGLERQYEVGFVGKLGRRGTRRYEVLTTVLNKYQTNDYRKYYLPAEMGRVYSQSRIVLNASINGDLNMRVFEAMAAGALLVTDRIENGLPKLFGEGEHYVGYSSMDEAIEKITYFLSHENERATIAGRAQELVSMAHTYDRRWETVLQKVGQLSVQRPALARSMLPFEVARGYGAIFEARGDPLGVARAIYEYGHALALTPFLIRGCLRALNKRVPFTPAAVRAQLKTR